MMLCGFHVLLKFLFGRVLGLMSSQNCLWALRRRKPLVASIMPAVVQRNAMLAFRHRFTLRQTRRTVPIMFSMLLVQASWHCVGTAMTTMQSTKERWCEAEVNRVAREIALKSPEPDATKAEAYFERALAVARQQQAKSWELRAAMSLARLWRDQGKPQQARELLAPIYGWFTEGFDTRDLKEAKALLEELAA